MKEIIESDGKIKPVDLRELARVIRRKFWEYELTLQQRAVIECVLSHTWDRGRSSVPMKQKWIAEETAIATTHVSTAVNYLVLRRVLKKDDTAIDAELENFSVVFANNFTWLEQNRREKSFEEIEKFIEAELNKGSQLGVFPYEKPLSQAIEETEIANHVQNQVTENVTLMPHVSLMPHDHVRHDFEKGHVPTCHAHEHESFAVDGIMDRKTRSEILMLVKRNLNPSGEYVEAWNRRIDENAQLVWDVCHRAKENGIRNPGGWANTAYLNAIQGKSYWKA